MMGTKKINNYVYKKMKYIRRFCSWARACSRVHLDFIEPFSFYILAYILSFSTILVQYFRRAKGLTSYLTPLKCSLKRKDSTEYF